VKTSHHPNLSRAHITPAFGHQVSIELFGPGGSAHEVAHAVTLRSDGTVELYDGDDMTYGELHARIIDVITGLVDVDDLATPCAIACHGACPPHGWEYPEVPCPIGRARLLLQDMGVQIKDSAAGPAPEMPDVEAEDGIRRSTN